LAQIQLKSNTIRKYKEVKETVKLNEGTIVIKVINPEAININLERQFN
jgi:hypothetical protein